VFVPTSSGLSKLVSKGKNSLLSDNLLQTIDDTIFDNSFANQHQFDYSKSSNNKYDETLNPNMTVNVDNDDIDEEMISHVLNL